MQGFEQYNIQGLIEQKAVTVSFGRDHKKSNDWNLADKKTIIFTINLPALFMLSVLLDRRLYFHEIFRFSQ